jgi:sugar phosphate isomerase/epimerase
MDLGNVMMFSKHLQGMPLEQAAALLAGIGIKAVDLTVRPGGHVEPAAVEDQLPRAAGVLADQGLRIGMITTAITDAADPLTRRVLSTAARLGVGYYKLGYYPYRGFGTLRKQRQEVAARLQALAALNLELGIHAGFHNHSADSLGASLWDIDAVLGDIEPKAIGLYFDPTHATIEGGSAGWLMGMDLLSSRLTMLAVKDFRWADGKHRYAGARRHSVEMCPLEVGNTPWPEVIKHLQTIGFAGPISFHGEYQGPHSFADLTCEQVIQQTAKDLSLFRVWAAAGALAPAQA